MHSFIRGIGKLFGLIFSGFLLVSCGGGGSSGGFTTPGDTLSIEITANDTVLPANETLEGPDPARPFTNTFTVVVRDEEGKIFPAESITVALNAPDGTGALYYLDGDPDHEEDITAGNPPVVVGTAPLAFRNQVFEDTSGIITSHFHAGSQSGTASIVASVIDPASGSSASASLQITVVAQDNTISSLTFTGPFVEAVRAGEASFIGNGTFTREISVIASDANGQPVSPDTQIDFFLVDSPIAGFPGAGSGSFLVAGNNGDPLEGGVQFFAAGGNFISNGVRIADRLVLDGGQTDLPDNRDLTGIRTINAVVSSSQVNVSEPFNLNGVGDQGPTVPYIIGRARYGTVLSTAFTNVAGVATTLLTYPAQRLGQTAVLVACSTDKSVCGVLNTCDANGANCNSVYLPTADGISITGSPTAVPANTSADVEICVRSDGIGVPGAAIDFAVLGVLGAGTVTVNGQGPTGTVGAEANGCAVVTIASSGIVPGVDNDPANAPRVEFTTDGVDGDTAFVVEIIPPEAFDLRITTVDCPNRDAIEAAANTATTPAACPSTPLSCNVNLLLLSDLGVPVQGIPVRSTFDSQEVDSVVFNPNENGAGVTSETGETTAVVNFALRNDGTTINYGGTVTFDAGGQQGGATVDFTIDLTCP